MEPRHCKVLNLQGFEFGAIDRDTADRQPPNGQCADRECAHCDRADRGGDRCYAAEAQGVWTTEILAIYILLLKPTRLKFRMIIAVDPRALTESPSDQFAITRCARAILFAHTMLTRCPRTQPRR